MSATPCYVTLNIYNLTQTSGVSIMTAFLYPNQGIWSPPFPPAGQTIVNINVESNALLYANNTVTPSQGIAGFLLMSVVGNPTWIQLNFSSIAGQNTAGFQALNGALSMAQMADTDFMVRLGDSAPMMEPGSLNMDSTLDGESLEVTASTDPPPLQVGVYKFQMQLNTSGNYFTIVVFVTCQKTSAAVLEATKQATAVSPATSLNITKLKVMLYADTEQEGDDEVGAGIVPEEIEGVIPKDDAEPEEN